MPTLSSLDHLVLTVADMSKTIAFYTKVLGMTEEVFHPADGSTRHALTFGVQKINLHPAAAPFEPKASKATAGSADLCFLTESSPEDWIAQFHLHDIAIEEGPEPRTGATGPILSLYVRDPDGNLIEISTKLPT
jgi:catechol 2,3-dioxygenase-like lactoylglutathione lyase family enzyme